MGSCFASLSLTATVLLAACSDVRVVDDDGAQGGSPVTTSGGGEGGAPVLEPASARLFAWYYDDDTRAIHFWNDPDERGVDRDPDGVIEVESCQGFAAAGSKLFVATPGQVLIFDDLWQLETGASVSSVLGTDRHAMTAAPKFTVVAELDLLWAAGHVYRGASQLTSAATPVAVSWSEPVYDPVRDRLFVVEGGAVHVIDRASASTSFEPTWTLYGGESVAMLASDGDDLFASRLGTDGSFGWKVLTWPLSRDPGTEEGDLKFGPPGEIMTLTAIPAGGVVAGAEGGLVAWANGSVSSPEPSGQLYTPKESQPWTAASISKAGHVYAYGPGGLSVFTDTTLSTTLASGLLTGEHIFLAER